jgi:GNAT superfamily N-acetyltransferase
VIRRARPDDVPAIGAVFLAARDGMTYLPRIPAPDRPRIGSLITAGRDEVWVDERDGRVAAFVALNGDELDHIYVDPPAQGRGLGAALLRHVMERRPDGFGFWVFQRNVDARRFYERHGCRLVRETDGTANMEREPDARYEWRPRTVAAEADAAA